MSNPTATPNTIAWLKNQTDVDTAVAVLLDRADEDERAAAERGKPRSAQAGVRHLRYLARQLAPLGTGEAFEQPVEPERAPAAHAPAFGGE